MTETAADEQDLAKALDSVASAASSFDSTNSAQSDSAASSTGMDGNVSLPPIVPLDSPVAPVVSSPLLPTPGLAADDTSSPTITNVHGGTDDPQHGDDNSRSNDASSPAPEPVVTGPLADIKSDALNELRPLVDKLTVSPEEKFDTYLLLIRSTDDTSLIAPAHEAAKAIEDEARRAEALLDIIKEIDYLSRQDKGSSN